MPAPVPRDLSVQEPSDARFQTPARERETLTGSADLGLVSWQPLCPTAWAGRPGLPGTNTAQTGNAKCGSSIRAWNRVKLKRLKCRNPIRDSNKGHIRAVKEGGENLTMLSVAVRCDLVFSGSNRTSWCLLRAYRADP